MDYTIITGKPLQVIGAELKTQLNGPDAQQIPAFLQKNFAAGTLQKIPNKVNTHANISGYTDYDAAGNYTYIMGSFVTSLAAVPEGMKARNVPAQKYAMFTVKGSGKHIIEFWRNLWSKQWTFERAFTFDYELYDERYTGDDNSVVDIYISIK